MEYSAHMEEPDKYISHEIALLCVLPKLPVEALLDHL